MRQVETSKVSLLSDRKVRVNYSYLSSIGRPVNNKALIVKRICDIVLGSIGCVLSLPIIFLFSILIKLTSKGPVFYKQLRVGFMGKEFKVIKLRSMYQNAEATTGEVWAQRDDPRITRVGKYMRKTRIDELPQFWNVLKGDMSLVGPRPERPRLTEKFFHQFPDFPKRLRVIPGITGYAQINGGYDVSPDQKCEMDNYYIEHYSLWLDVKVLFGTIRIIFTGDGAR